MSKRVFHAMIDDAIATFSPGTSNEELLAFIDSSRSREKHKECCLECGSELVQDIEPVTGRRRMTCKNQKCDKYHVNASAYRLVMIDGKVVW